MPIQIAEAVASNRRTGRKTESITVDFNCYGSNQPLAIYQEFKATAPTSIVSDLGTTLYASEYDLTTTADPFAFVGTVTYTNEQQADDWRFSCTVGGQTQHLDVSLDTVATYSWSATQTPPDFGRRIGVIPKDGAVQGVDAVIPQFRFEIAGTMLIGDVSSAASSSDSTENDSLTLIKLVQIANLVGTLADGEFLSFARGEVMFESFQASQKSNTEMDVVFGFWRERNRDDLVIGNVPHTGTISKLGFEYLWVLSEPVKDATSKRRFPVPKFAYVEQVYRFADWTVLPAGAFVPTNVVEA